VKTPLAGSSGIGKNPKGDPSAWVIFKAAVPLAAKVTVPEELATLDFCIYKGTPANWDMPDMGIGRVTTSALAVPVSTAKFEDDAPCTNDDRAPAVTLLAA